jgi:hypothetical protein
MRDIELSHLDSLIEFLDAEDQQMARQLICAQGYSNGVDSNSHHSVDANTMVVMTPTDADFFGDSYLYWLNVEPARWSVLWQNVYDLADGQNVAIKLHEYQSSTQPVSKAVIIASLSKSAGEIRGMVLFAVDNGVRLENCRVECPWMSQGVFDELKHDFGDEWAAKAMSTVGVVPDALVEGVSLGRLLNLPEKALAYMPARVAALM